MVRDPNAEGEQNRTLSVYYARAMDAAEEDDLHADDASVRDAMEKAGFRIVNPYLGEAEVPIDSQGLVEGNSAIMAEASVLVANLSRPHYAYVGVWFEMAEAYARRIPVVAWVGSTGYERHHYLKAHCEFIGEDVETVVEYLSRACTPAGVAAQLAEAQAYYDAIAGSYGRTARKTYPGGRNAQYVLERDRLAERLVESCCGKRVLELGCGDGDWTASIAKSARQVCCVDASPSMIAHAKKRLVSAPIQPQFIQCDVFDRAMRFDGYDVIVVFFLLGFMPRRAQRALLSRIRGACDVGAVVLFAESVRQSAEPSRGLDAVRLQARNFEGRRFVICKEVFSGRALASRVSSAGLEVVEELRPASWFSFCTAKATGGW